MDLARRRLLLRRRGARNLLQARCGGGTVRQAQGRRRALRPITPLYPCRTSHHAPTPTTPLRAPPAQVRFAQPMLSSMLVGGAVALDLTIFTLPGEAGGGTWYAT